MRRVAAECYVAVRAVALLKPPLISGHVPVPAFGSRPSEIARQQFVERDQINQRSACDKITVAHSITSSAIASSVGGMTAGQRQQREETLIARADFDSLWWLGAPWPASPSWGRLRPVVVPTP
jgi:hypothetical protein